MSHDFSAAAAVRFIMDTLEKEFEPSWSNEKIRKFLRTKGDDFHYGTSTGKKNWPRACKQYLKYKSALLEKGISK